MLSSLRYATVLSTRVHNLTVTASDDSHDGFYDELGNTLQTMPSSDEIFLIGDLTAQVDLTHTTWGGIITTYGIGKVNSSGSACLILVVILHCAGPGAVE